MHNKLEYTLKIMLHIKSILKPLTPIYKSIEIKTRFHRIRYYHIHIYLHIYTYTFIDALSTIANTLKKTRYPKQMNGL